MASVRPGSEGRAAQVKGQSNAGSSAGDVVVEIGVEALEARIEVGGEGDEEQFDVKAVEPERAGEPPEPEGATRPVLPGVNHLGGLGRRHCFGRRSGFCRWSGLGRWSCFRRWLTAQAFGVTCSPVRASSLAFGPGDLTPLVIPGS